MVVKNRDGREILWSVINAVHENKQYLGDIDGLIGDGDHGMNMNKGFMTYGERLGEAETDLTDGLSDLGMVLLNEIGGSMGPIYGTFSWRWRTLPTGKRTLPWSFLRKCCRRDLTGCMRSWRPSRRQDAGRHS